ncbi:hypothetical protein UFOVP402_55 [uncultured Caudovirales phage]|uniref:Uncharacterized protein n=1 Tax=uncultured Caudovirales phage TaxID=2100421 RepID=A0A6J5M1J5_9CAUD|nr:hypothetical protein UFOVP402_55 [uncultured Caudovirales phage]
MELLIIPAGFFIMLLISIWLFYENVLKPEQEFKAHLREKYKYSASPKIKKP